MPLNVTVHLHDKRWKKLLRPYCKTVRDTCEEALPNGQYEIAVVLADDAFIKALNRDFRGKNSPTNVLSFPSDGLPEKGAKQKYLGDIVMALETVEREAKSQKKLFKHHAIHLLVHGTLHLLGYDHEQEDDAEAMESKEIKILKKLKVNNPYL
jgi:probable rRNA maturation factor